MRIGESRHAEKSRVRDELQKQSPDKGISATDIRTDTIHSIKTREIYEEHCAHFVEWCIQEKNINKYASLSKIEDLTKEYLKEREEKGLSLYTLKAERAALAKLYGHEIDYKFKEARTIDKITRSRNECKKDKRFSFEKNIDLVNVCRGTGGRRDDIARLTPSRFFEDRNGNLWVRFEESKGGRDRISPVLPRYQEQIKEIIKNKEPNERLFEKIHDAADIHSFRRDYAKELYELVRDNPEKQEQYKEKYPEREQKGYDTYFARGSDFKGKKDDIYIVSEALGHNRLSVTVNHYLK